MDEPIKFLLVDDVEANLTALEGLLKQDGLGFLKARSGPEALEFLLGNEIALAFIDVHMPGMNGFELAEVMRGTRKTRQVPIVFLTAEEVDADLRRRGYELGAVDFLPKPIDSNNLLNKAAVFHELARQRRELEESEARLREANERLAATNRDLARADRNKDEFLAMLAHELRNPLAPLRHASAILSTDRAGPDAAEQAVRMIDRQIGNLARMVDDLLDVARITQGRVELRRQPLELQAVLNSAAGSARAACEAAGQRLLVSLPEQPIAVDGDATRLEQVVVNLLNNACKYSGPGSDIRLSAEIDGEGAGRTAVVRVTDNGAGIDPDLLPRIFDLFSQASRSADRSQGGLGIGLTIASRLVTLHGGTLEAASEGLGKGAEFRVRLPVLAAAPAEVPDRRQEPAPGATGLRLLVVDDNHDAASSLAMLQELEGHQTRTASSGEEALRVAEEFRPDAVLLDIGLPDLDGLEVARRLRRSEATRTAFLVALTGYGSEQDRARTREAGFDEHLVKPGDLDLLRKLLENVGTATRP